LVGGAFDAGGAVGGALAALQRVHGGGPADVLLGGEHGGCDGHAVGFGVAEGAALGGGVWCRCSAASGSCSLLSRSTARSTALARSLGDRVAASGSSSASTARAIAASQDRVRCSSTAAWWR
jgi:hypothetical protein